jgi:acetyl-CoA carboxylase, biotin carboxylase subunit
MAKFQKILIANRGEIALRIIRTVKEMGIATVAVFSEADRNSLHVRNADEAVCIGPASSASSYLRGDKIIEVALKLGADAIHPGYGFLSENEDFAKKVIAAGLAFIGPSPEAIRIMGNKLAAKAAALKYNIPMVPGGDHAISNIEEAKSIAAKTGYPVLIKASAGGGGKGMRIVENEDSFAESMKRAVSEAQAAFGDGSVFIEKYISSPRHIEIQVLGDQHGNIVHLFERECSIQRRYQKVVEEAPSSVLDEALRNAMGKAAVDAARSCDYYNAGTVEFILDENNNYYFLEMNTRLQVEHPVTEMITGVDLVREQIKIAEGEKLSFRQEDLRIQGHAIELRIYAEDPANNFLPYTGKLLSYQRPQGPGIRVDDGFEEGMEIPVHYDPMIGKLIAYASNRREAIERMLRAIQEYKIIGIENTLAFGKFVMEHPAFISGKFDTHFVQKYFSPDKLIEKLADDELHAATAFAGWLIQNHKPVTSVKTRQEKGKWKTNRK